jgi:VanZ family protein
MASREQLQLLESRIVRTLTIATFLLGLAAFAGVLLAHKNTLAIVDPLIRWVRPAAASADIERIHNVARKFGHFLIPAAAFALLVIGPLRKRPGLALILCVLFAVIDESVQTLIPGRIGSLADVILDASGAIFAYFTYRAIALASRTPEAPYTPCETRGRR